MDAEESANLIAVAGGPKKFAEFLGLDKDDGVKQRIGNWKRRGIPAEVVLEHYELFQRLKRKAAKH